MGKIVYDRLVTVEFPDFELAHLQAVIGAKLRRGESFFFSWAQTGEQAPGSRSIWLHASASLLFEYDDGGPRRLNRPWIEALSASANTTAGLRPVPEPRSPVAG